MTLNKKENYEGNYKRPRPMAIAIDMTRRTLSTCASIMGRCEADCDANHVVSPFFLDLNFSQTWKKKHFTY